MSFGFSVSDIYGCARLAYVLYNEFTRAPGACQDFARELLLFHQALVKTKSTIEAEKRHLSDADGSGLGICLDSCKELLYVQIIGAAEVPKDLDKIDFGGYDPEGKCILRSTSKSNEKRFLSGLRQRIRERKFASRIPKLQQAISAHIETLTAFGVLGIQSSQYGIQGSQKRIEQCIGESRDLLTKSTNDYVLQFETLSDRLETSQSRIEAQLQNIITNQQRTRTPILSRSLDASSPEGRQTWMELGRFLRDEGITPAMIQENRELLVNAMKSTLEAESVPESYTTAPEYNYSLNVPTSRNLSHQDFASAFSSVSLFGSAPRRSAGFTDAFLERQRSVPSSLSQEQNVDDGMRSLLQGMNGGDSRMGKGDNDMDNVELEDIELEELELKGDSGDDDSFDNDPHQKRALKHVVKPLVPTSERGEFSGFREAEGADIPSGVPSREANVPIERRPIMEYWQKTMSSYHNDIQRPVPGVLDPKTASDHVPSPELGPPSESRVSAEPGLSVPTSIPKKCTCNPLWDPGLRMTNEPGRREYPMSWSDMGFRYRQRLSEYERESGCDTCCVGKSRSMDLQGKVGGWMFTKMKRGSG